MNERLPVILGIDEERSRQSTIARAFDDQGVTYRFVSDRRRVGPALAHLVPDLAMVYGELDSDFALQVLDGLTSDVAHSALPVLVLSEANNDTGFVGSMRTGVVGVLPLPFQRSHIATTLAIFAELPSRGGVAYGRCDAVGMGRLLDALRRTRRSGLLQVEARGNATPQGKAFFHRGMLERASFGTRVSREALRAMCGLRDVDWSFTELAGGRDGGAGVVIELDATVHDDPSAPAPRVGDESSGEELLTFEMQVPLGAEADSPTVQGLGTSAAATRILMVDDDTTLLHLFSALFVKRGFEVATATDGARGFELATERRFDVVIADLNMPRLDGWGLLRRLREDFRTRELPVVFLSAQDDFRESLRALDAGAQAYLPKGTRLDSVVSQVQKLLEPRAAVADLLGRGEPVPLSLGELGPQWLLCTLGAARRSGTVEAKDGFASYAVVLRDGAPVHALAQAGRYVAEGERAFNAFVASRGASGTWRPGRALVEGASLASPLEALLEQATTTLNANEQRVRDELLVKASSIVVNEPLYAVYRQVGPPEWVEIARLLCVEKKPPREAISLLDVSPLDFEDAMRDLVRRGVIALKKAP